MDRTHAFSSRRRRHAWEGTVQAVYAALHLIATLYHLRRLGRVALRRPLGPCHECRDRKDAL